MTSKPKIRVRFAPSPTGFLHVGSARTALFNWLFAKHNAGIFILRIEDTDLTRSQKEFEENIYEGLKWLGLNWDEGPDIGGSFGPYRQSERLKIYQEYTYRLVKEGQAYECYCSQERLNELREKAEKEKKPFIYDGRCRNLTPEEKNKLKNSPFVIRFKTENKIIKVNDLIKGPVQFDTALIGDQIISKSDGLPTYNFACVIDDVTMKITHIIRGEDHLSNTPKQVLFYEALAEALPIFAHIPMILGPDRSKLSKRHGAVSVTQYRDEGFLAEAFFNYLALLGWSPGDDQEIMSREEIIQKFSLEKISPSPAIFDVAKLKWLNGIYIRQKLSRPQLTSLILAEAEKLSLNSLKDIAAVIASGYQNQIELLTEIPIILKKVSRLQEKVEYQPDQTKKILESADLEKILKAAIEGLKKLPDFTPEVLNIFIEELVKNTGLTRGKVFRPLRYILSGNEIFPELQYVFAFLGREKCQERIEYFWQQIKAKII